MGNQIKQEWVDWARNLVASANEGATWKIPYNGVTYRIEVANKRLVQIDGPKEWEDFDLHVEVFGRMGWKIISLASMQSKANPGENWSTIRKVQ